MLVFVHRDLKPRRLPHFKLEIIEAVGVELWLVQYSSLLHGSAAKLKSVQNPEADTAQGKIYQHGVRGTTMFKTDTTTL